MLALWESRDLHKAPWVPREPQSSSPQPRARTRACVVSSASHTEQPCRRRRAPIKRFMGRRRSQHLKHLCQPWKQALARLWAPRAKTQVLRSSGHHEPEKEPWVSRCRRTSATLPQDPCVLDAARPQTPVRSRGRPAGIPASQGNEPRMGLHPGPPGRSLGPPHCLLSTSHLTQQEPDPGTGWPHRVRHCHPA